MFNPYDSVDSIVSVFSKTLERLNSLAGRRDASAVYNRQLVAEYTAAAEGHEQEAARARTISAKIGALLNDNG